MNMDKDIKLTLRWESSREARFAFEMQVGLARFWKESAREGGSDGWRRGLRGLHVLALLKTMSMIGVNGIAIKSCKSRIGRMGEGERRGHKLEGGSKKARGR